MKKKRLIFCLLIIIVFAVTVVFAILFIRKNTQLTMEGAINRRLSKKVINDYIEIDKMEYCPQALEMRKREVEQLRGNEKTYEEIFEEKNEKNKNLGIQYEIRNVEVLSKEKQETNEDFPPSWNITGIEEVYRVHLYYEQRWKYEFDPNDYDKEYYNCLDFRENDNGVWFEWQEMRISYEVYKVEGKWYCMYSDE